MKVFSITKGATLEGQVQPSKIEAFGTYSGTNIDWLGQAGRVYDNAVVCHLVSWFVRASSRCEMILQKRDAMGNWQREEPTTGPAAFALNAIREPNEFYGEQVLQAIMMANCLVSGNGYWVPTRNAPGWPIGYYGAPYGSVTITQGTGFIESYQYTSANSSIQRLAPSEIMHFRYLVPGFTDTRVGLSPFAGVLRDISAENEAANYTASLMSDLGMPPLMLVPKDQEANPPTPEQKTRLGEWWRRLTKDRRGSAPVSPYPFAVEKLGFSPNDLSMDKIRGFNASIICSALGVSPMVIGLNDPNKTYSNMKEAREAAFEGAILPLMSGWAAQFTKWARVLYRLDMSYRFTYDLADVRELQEDVDALWKRTVDAYARGVITRAEAKRMLGQEFDEAADNVYFTDIGGGLGMDAAKSMLKKDLLEKQRRNRLTLERVIEDVFDGA